jgi:diadenosine tetraphosphatase ApaH/serine/threonine PP2A family protein phosphatase
VRARLDDAAIEKLANDPLTATLEIGGLGEVLFCHATPRDASEIRTAISPDERWREVLDGVTEGVVVCGHTHVQFDGVVGGTRIVNAGSIGMPYEDEPGAYWALLGAGRRASPVDVRRRGGTRRDRGAGLSVRVARGIGAGGDEYFESTAYD